MLLYSLLPFFKSVIGQEQVRFYIIAFRLAPGKLVAHLQL